MNKNRGLFIIFMFTAVCSLVYSCQSERELNYARYYTNGKKLYDISCQNCHGKNGEGLGQLIPPLTDTLYIQKNINSIACTIKFGINDIIKVHGVTYAEQMPPNSQLADIDIAALVTYISNSFGNQQGLYEVNQASVDLKKCEEVYK
ncbi:c-type cytochrome [Arcticibacter svalbardensis]|nr:cytochrome c [Arcticibacter svalbardensis]